MKKKLVILTGSGISAESGIPTFRDKGGLWMGYDVDKVATLSGFEENPQYVLDFYNMLRKAMVTKEPNAAHKGLVDLEEYFDVQIITQNVDDLHERAGSSKVLHLHGELLKMRSVEDTSHTNIYEIKKDIQIGTVDFEGYQMRPHIVWFGEDVPALTTAAELVYDADFFVVIGTSLQVYPAAGLLHYVKGDIPIYLIDKVIPSTEGVANKIIPIKKKASSGVKELKRILYPLK